ncbi:alpha/beta hydrolase family protein [Brevibacillus dissolubilis]|uniref:alpha/beta hydrolase family protein n=1 Tax=Brevibacillus dissolubilis TaxID=1844116 RepID=UPI00159BE46E|nr:alpha/beta hydrolase [Brevibacillus dissolubilis]
MGNLYPADSQAIIIMCHGFTSDKSSKGRFDRFAARYQQLGYNALAFDFSGCGESDDDRLTLSKLVDDLHAAIAFAKSQGFTRIALHGHSLGSRVCLEAYTPEIITMVLSGAGTGPVEYNWHEIYTPEQMRELEEKGYITDFKAEGPRKAVIVDRQMLLDFANFSQEELLKKVTCPVLLIHGNQGAEEKLLSEITKQGIKWLSADSRLEIIDGAQHSFMEHLPIVERLATDWLEKHVPLGKE